MPGDVAFGVGGQARAHLGSNKSVGARVCKSHGQGRLCAGLQPLRRFRPGPVIVCTAANAIALHEIHPVEIRETKELPQEWDAPGCYAVSDDTGAVQYVEMSGRVSASLMWHLSSLPPQQCFAARVKTWSQADPEQIEATARAWIEAVISETGAPPPGNNPRLAEARAWRERPTTGPPPGYDRPNLVLGKEGCDILDRIRETVEQFPVVLFMKGSRQVPLCGFSARTVEILNGLKIDYQAVDVLDETKNQGLRQAIKDFSQWPTIPQLFVHGEFVGGADIVQEMSQTGELQSLLQDPLPNSTSL
mmetsp:Transcript_14362/g.29408  ORF Transcript_14362/g.29408 Transcript_14362/m.29408 type:complete len:304 (-) Transcript_14362:480-1391(-)